MKLKEIIKKWVDAFNQTDADSLTDLYADDAVNHRVVASPVNGKTVIRKMY